MPGKGVSFISHDQRRPHHLPELRKRAQPSDQRAEAFPPQAYMKIAYFVKFAKLTVRLHQAELRGEDGMDKIEKLQILGGQLFFQATSRFS